MPDPVPEWQKANRKNYIRCDPCSQAAGEAVLYHRSQLQLVQPFLGEDHYECPEGHTVELPKEGS